MAAKAAPTIAAALMTVVLPVHLLRAEVPGRVEVLANACAVCHGTDGRGAQKIPKLNGELKVFDFVITMKGYANGTERSTVMGRIAKGLTE